MNTMVRGLRVAAVTGALPRSSLSLEQLAGHYAALDVKRIMRTTGIEAVRVAEELTTGDLCCAAAQHLFESHGVAAATIDGLVVVTQTPDRMMPPTSTMLQHRLGLHRGCVAIDINYGCSGYIYGLYQAALMVACGGCRSVLVCTGDVVTKLLAADDHHVRLLFGDAATATLVQVGPDSIAFDFLTDGSGADHIRTPLAYSSGAGGSCVGGHLAMDGGKVMEFVLAAVPRMLQRFLRELDVTIDQVQLWLMHQANAFIVGYLRKMLGLRHEQVPLNVKHVGNTGPSSIPLLLAMVQPSALPERQRTMLCGFGVGLSIGAAYLPLIETACYAPIDVPH